MEILEFGDKENKKIILIHGFQSPYQVWNRYIERYKGDFHVIVPILPGHNPKEEEDFVSFTQTAKEIEDYCISCYGNEVYAVFAMSMGGVLAATIWQNKRLKIEKVIFDGSPLVSFNGFMKKQFIRFYLDITHKTQQREIKTIAQAVNTIIAEENLEDFLSVLDHMTDATIENYIRSIGDYKLPSDIDTPETKVYFFHGTKMNEVLAKKTVKYIKKHYLGAVIKCFEGKGHCENSLLEPDLMMQELSGIL